MSFTPSINILHHHFLSTIYPINKDILLVFIQSNSECIPLRSLLIHCVLSSITLYHFRLRKLFTECNKIFFHRSCKLPIITIWTARSAFGAYLYFFHSSFGISALHPHLFLEVLSPLAMKYSIKNACQNNQYHTLS